MSPAPDRLEGLLLSTPKLSASVVFDGANSLFVLRPADAEPIFTSISPAAAEALSRLALGRPPVVAGAEAPKEIERKFLLKIPGTFDGPVLGAESLTQGFLSTDPSRVVRVRVSDSGEAWLTVKGKSEGMSRVEIESPIDPAAARLMLDHSVGALIEKRRTKVSHAGNTWEVDEYFGANSGLWTVEVEARSEAEALAVAVPDWVGSEITTDFRYSNSALAERPVGSRPLPKP